MKCLLAWAMAGICGVSLAQDAAAGHPFFRAEGWPRWSAMTPQQLVVDTEAALAETSRQMEAIASLTPEAATFENTFVAYMRVGEQLKQVQRLVAHLMNVRPSEELHAAQMQMLEAVVRHSAQMMNGKRMGEVLHAAAAAPWAAELPENKKRYVQQVLRTMRESGAGLTAEQMGRKVWLEKELQLLYRQFNLNLQQGLEKWELVITNPEELDGMPADWMQRSAAFARAGGHGTDSNPAWVVNLTSCPAVDVVTYCRVEETRRRCWEGATGLGTRHTIDNEPVLRRAMALRQELAELMGYRHFADMQAAKRMMGSGEAALAFVDELLAVFKPAYDAEAAEYLEKLSRVKGEKVHRIEPWNEFFYAKDIPADQEAFDVSQLTPYFSAEKVITGMMRIWEQLLGIRIEEQKALYISPGDSCPEGAVEVWHPLVRAFTVHDAASGKHLGSFYMDLYPRLGKQQNAWCMPLQFAIPGSAGEIREPHIATLVANITPPIGQHHLLHHGDLYTLFHEFGHLMHMLLGHAPLPEQHSMLVEPDFVEMPSQLQESWAWEPEALATFARHFQTGEALPAELAEKLAASRRNGSVMGMVEMLCIAKLDLELHLNYREKFENRPLDEAAAEILAPWQLPYTCATPCALRTVHHVLNQGYAASFYTYKWSELLAADAFSRFRKEGIMNPATGADYRKCILEPGGSMPAMQLFRKFMGREPDPTALKELYGSH